jgi:hypothetical protein
MLGDLSIVYKSIKYILIDLMDEKVLSTGVEASSTRGVEASPLTARRFGPSQTTTVKQSKHHNDLENTKLIPSIFPLYTPPLAGAVSRDSIPRDFDYTLIIAYLTKGIHIVGL